MKSTIFSENIWKIQLLNEHVFVVRQYIIGLRQNNTKELLVELFYLTFLVVTTAIQLLIFHNKYTKQYLWKSTGIQANIEENIDSNEQSNPKQDESAERTFLETVSWIYLFRFEFVLEIHSDFQSISGDQ